MEGSPRTDAPGEGRGPGAGDQAADSDDEGDRSAGPRRFPVERYTISGDELRAALGGSGTPIAYADDDDSDGLDAALKLADPYDPENPFAGEDLDTQARLTAIRDHQYTYIRGDAGTGKSYLARKYAELSDDAILLATTGIAAVNLGGTTINSCLRYYDTASMQLEFEYGRLGAALRQLGDGGTTRLVIDEISMLDGRQLDILTLALDDANAWLEAKGKRQIGVCLTGDFAQLPPVGVDAKKKDPRDTASGQVLYAFQAKEWPRWGDHMITLTDIKRQADPDFIKAIQQVRVGDRGAVDYFRRFIFPTELTDYSGTSILAKNDEVDRYNRIRMLRLDTPEIPFTAQRTGKESDAPKEWKNIPDTLVLKPGCLVMILANAYTEGPDREIIYANGDLATFKEKISNHHALVTLQRTNSDIVVTNVVRERLKPGVRRHKKTTVIPPENILATIDYMPLRVAYASTCHKCVAPDTRIPVIGLGYIPIRDVQPHSHVTPYGPILGKVQTKQPGMRLTTKRGYSVVCSPNHRWMTKRGWVETSHLVSTDHIELNAGIPFAGVRRGHTRYLAQTKAWVLGALVGDGCYTDLDDGTVEFTCSHFVFGEQFRQAATQEFAVNPKWRKDDQGLTWTSQKFRRLLLSWGFDYVKAPEKRIPAIIWEQGPASRGAFLQGLFDTDGHIGRNRIILTTASEQLAKDVQELLLTLGILSKRASYPGVHHSVYWQIYVGAESREKFIQWVGFRHPEKATRLHTDRPNRALNPAFGYDQIAEVKYLGHEIPMIDVEVTEPHILAFGPFHGHNSQGLTLDNVQVMINSHFWLSAGLLYVGISRARTPQGLRIVGTPEQFAARIRANPMVQRWL